MNSAPPSGASSELDGAAVELDELLHDRQAEARAAAALARCRRCGSARTAPRAARPARRRRCRRPRAAPCAPSSTSVQRAMPPGGVKRSALASRLEITRLMRSGSKREVQLVRRLDDEPDLALAGERVELLGDRADDAGEVVVDQRQARLAVVAADLLEHRVDLLERVQGGQPDALRLRLQRPAAAVAPQPLGAREDDLQRRAEVVRELGEQPLAEVVDAREPVGQHGQLGVLARDPLLRALAVGHLAALGDDERDAAVGAAQRAQHEVDGLRRRCRRCPSSARRRSARSGRRRPAPRRAAGRPARPRSAGTTASATAGARRPRGGRCPADVSGESVTSSSRPSARSSAMKLVAFASATWAIRRRASGSDSGSATSSRRACSACCTSIDARQGSSRPCLTVGGFLPVLRAPWGESRSSSRGEPTGRSGQAVNFLALGWPGA